MKKLAILVSVLFISSCSKDIINAQNMDQDNSPQLSSYSGMDQVFADFYSHEYKFNVILTGSAHRLLPLSGLARIDATFLDESQELIEGVLTVNGVDYATDPEHKNIYVPSNPGVSCFERYNFIKFTNAQGVVLLDTGLYIPKEVFISSVDYTIHEGLNITYNADNNNKNGVAFLVTFRPEETENTSFSAHPVVYNVAHDSSDDGVFVVPSTLLAGIPAGASVSVECIRGNINFQTANPNSFALLGFCSSGTYMRVQ